MGGVRLARVSWWEHAQPPKLAVRRHRSGGGRALVRASARGGGDPGVSRVRCHGGLTSRSTHVRPLAPQSSRLLRWSTVQGGSGATDAQLRAYLHRTHRQASLGFFAWWTLPSLTENTRGSPANKPETQTGRRGRRSSLRVGAAQDERRTFPPRTLVEPPMRPRGGTEALWWSAPGRRSADRYDRMRAERTERGAEGDALARRGARTMRRRRCDVNNRSVVPLDHHALATPTRTFWFSARFERSPSPFQTLHACFGKNGWGSAVVNA